METSVWRARAAAPGFGEATEEAVTVTAEEGLGREADSEAAAGETAAAAAEEPAAAATEGATGEAEGSAAEKGSAAGGGKGEEEVMAGRPF